jgi:hypothetical protein
MHPGMMMPRMVNVTMVKMMLPVDISWPIVKGHDAHHHALKGHYFDQARQAAGSEGKEDRQQRQG